MADVFLLGGCDLEMCVIKRLLEKYNKKFYDKNLKWGAKLSSYKEEIKNHQNDTIYAIELENDLNLKNIVLIDHHNENSSNLSSLEQTAKILNHKLNKFEKMVSVNDSRYIDGMIEKRFKLKDIKKIRHLDRKCQGVSKEEEEKAKKIELKRIMEVDLEHFSPLNDRIFFEKGWKKYIIFNDKLTMFYGFDIESLKRILKKEGIEEFFYGGGERGFLGVERKLDKKFLKRIFELKDIISHHIFMFPFVIEKEKRRDYEKILKEKGWKEKKFNVDVLTYNEAVYFYKHVRDVLFGLEEHNSLKIYEINKEGKYIIQLKNNKIYELEIEKLSLRVFNNSIGILSFHLNNNEYNAPYDILKINEYGRRIFPQFLDKNDFIETTKNSFLADKITLIFDNDKIEENFSKFSDDEKLKKLNLKDIDKELIPEFITKFVGNDIKIILDDRMFVVSFYLDTSKKVLNNLTSFDNGKNEYGYVNNDWWYQYVFVDGNSKTCQSKIMCKRLIKYSTYDRWVDYGTLWGISRYSFVGIGTWDLMIIHTKTIYFQIMNLLLLYRAMLVYFSDEVQDIVENIRNDKTNKKENIRDKSKQLYGDYLKFLNGLYFKEVTAQEQGIELYKKALKIMEIEEYIKDFDREISELDNYIEIEVEKERNEELDKLNKIATIFLPPTFIASFMGMNVGSFSDYEEVKFLLVVIFMFLSMIVSEMIFLRKDRKITNYLSKKIPFIEKVEKYKYWFLAIIVVGLILTGLIGGK